MKIALAVFMVWLMDLWERWYYAHDVDYFEGDLWSPRWIQWGSVLSWTTKKPMHRYCIMRLPSWDYIRNWNTEGWMWAQRAWLYFGRFPPHTTRGRGWLTWVSP